MTIRVRGCARYAAAFSMLAAGLALSACSGGGGSQGTTSGVAPTPSAGTLSVTWRYADASSADSRTAQSVYVSPNPFIAHPSLNPPSTTLQGTLSVSDPSGGVNASNYSCTGYIIIGQAPSGGTSAVYNIYSTYAKFTGAARSCQLQGSGNSGYAMVTVTLNGS